MQIVPSTVLALIVVLALCLKGPYRGLWVFLAATPFGVAAAFNLPAAGGASIMVSDLAALTLFCTLWLQPEGTGRILGTMRPFQPGFWLILLSLYCIVSAMIGPRFFEGATEVFSISRVNNQDGIISVPLRPTTGNLTQLFRIFLDACTFFALATVLRERPDARWVRRALTIATVVHVTLGWLDVMTALTGTAVLMEPIRTANYSILATDALQGIKRMIGGFSEASSFGYYTLGLFGFWLVYWIRARDRRGAGWMLILTTMVLLRSTSSSAYVAAVGFILTLIGIALTTGLRRSVDKRIAGLAIWSIVTGWLILMAAAAAYALISPVSAFIDRLLFDKLDTSSGMERMSWNVQAWKNFTDTALMGTGLGAMRASNWLLACLGAIGVIGTALFTAFLGTLITAPAPQDDPDRAATIRGLQCGCLAMFISAMLTAPTPDLSIFFFALAGLAAGLSRGAVVEMHAERPIRAVRHWRRQRS
ncbi:hypothetical protein FGG78_20125 [Thioclava sp. BHET1]|nr:hypothetical protein FGG78_20125 [Thioclava sp. BHET1]